MSSSRIVIGSIVFAIFLSGWQTTNAQGPHGSYMKVPRVHFSGKFFCDVSTVNNAPSNYDPKVTKPQPWWNPEGTHRIQFRDCVVTGAYDSNGKFVHQFQGDKLAAAKVESSAGVLVDLDTDQQGVSTFFGLSVNIVLPDGSSIGGVMDPTGLNGLWANVMSSMAGPAGGDFSMSASFQSVLRVESKKWPASSGSKIMDSMRALCDTDEDGNFLVLIKFVTDAYQDRNTNPNFRIGRITGTLAPRKAGEPFHTPGQRWLKPRKWNKDDPAQVSVDLKVTDKLKKYPDAHEPQQRWDFQVFNGGPFYVDHDRKKLVIDLGNSIPVNRTPDSAPNPNGNFQDESAIADVTAFVVDGDVKTEIGKVDVSAFCRLETAGIAEVPLTDEQMNLLKDNPLHLVADRVNSGDPAILTEDSSGLDFAVTKRVFRMANDIEESGEAQLGTFKSTQTSILVTQWGIPKSGVKLGCVVTDATTLIEPTGQIKTALQAPSIAPSNENGEAIVQLTAVGNPGSRTPQLDGQVYFLQVGLPTADKSRATAGRLRHGAAPTYYSEPLQERQISIHMYSDYAVKDDPNWSDIQPLMFPYAKLYPAMTEKINLANEDTFIFYSCQPPGKTPPLEMFLSAPFEDAGYMPITRDLSPNRQKTVMNFIKKLQEAPKNKPQKELQRKPRNQE